MSPVYHSGRKSALKTLTDESKDASPVFDAVAEAKRLLRTTRAAALATLAPPASDPFATLVNIASTADGSPILLLSRLAAHTRHLESDSRMSLLLYSALNRPSGGDPLTHPRLTLLGRAKRAADGEQQERLRDRFLARHPDSAIYAGFADFGFFQVTIEAAHLNGGFGRAANLRAESILTPLEEAEDLVGEEAKLKAEIESAEPEGANDLARAHGGARNGEARTWQIIGFDPEGLDLGDGESLIRVGFGRRVTTPAELRRAIVALLDDARAKAPK